MRIPAALVQKLGLKEGDDVKMELADHCSFKVQRRMTRDEALEVLRKSRRAMPADFKFNREEAHERPGQKIESLSICNPFNALV